METKQQYIRRRAMSLAEVFGLAEKIIQEEGCKPVVAIAKAREILNDRGAKQ